MSGRFEELNTILPGNKRVFTFSGRFAFLFSPSGHQPSGDRSHQLPWVWYAPTLEGKHPWKLNAWMFQKCLEAGMVVAGIDVGESYGNPEGRAIYTSFYKMLLDERSLSERPALLAQSRGGLMHYNWAIENPRRVACIAGIFPVCDISSYPGLQRAGPAYGMSEKELEKHLTEHNPIDRLAPLAREGVPILHVHGDSDEGVPIEENSQELVGRYRKLGGDARLITVQGKGHEEIAEFFECLALVDFILNQGRTGG